MRESIPEAKNESLNESMTSVICKMCKRDVTKETDENDVALHFHDTSGVFHSHNGDPNNDSVVFDNLSDKTPGGTVVGLAGIQKENPKAFKLYK